MDTDITMLPEGQYRYAENIRLLTDADGTTGMLQNIEHIRKYNGGIPSDETIIGTSNTLLSVKENNTVKEVGVVLTKKTLNNKIYNTLYIVDGFDSVDTITTPIVKGYLKIENNVSIVCNYESNNASNVYISDGLTAIKVINIEEQLTIIDENNGQLKEVIDSTKFDIIPGATLVPFKFVSKIDGALPAGAVQYCYQLFNMHGVETATAALSEVIPITNTASNSKDTLGENKGIVTNMGCQITASFKNDGRFDKARIFAIVYLDNTQVPDVYIANEIDIPYTVENEFVEFTYNDTGNSYLSKITIDEFNSYIPYEFNAKTITSLGNRLFAANIQELTWDVEFDARAYRCDIDGRIELQSADVTKNISGYLGEDGKIYSDSQHTSEITVDESHDCVNPTNTKVTANDSRFTYGYDSNGNKVRGGSGPNVSYQFVYTALNLSNQIAADNTPVANFYMDQVPQGYQSLVTCYEDGDICKITSFGSEGAIIPNYSDPYVCANFLGYQRDEVYRFGIILYNNKNVPSPVHWIGDIKMPASYYTSDTSSVLYPFHCGKQAGNFSGNIEMSAYALGVQFKVTNIPEGVVAYEIVRCDRTQADRTVITQGALSATVYFDEGKYGYGTSDTRPLPVLALPKDGFLTKCGGEKHLDHNYPVRKDCFEFVSPEVCISKDTIDSLIKDSYLNPLYYNYSWFNSSTATDSGISVGLQADRVYDLDGSKALDDTFSDPAYSNVWIHDNGNSYFDAGYLEKYQGKTVVDGKMIVCKYYSKEKTNNLPKAYTPCYKIEDSITTRILPLQISFEDTKSYVQFIGNYGYVNESILIDKYGANHGTSAIIIVNGIDPFISLSKNNAGVDRKMNEFNTTAICNVKRNIIPYGGNSYINRQNSIYQSCGCFNTNSNSSSMSSPVICYGGDTYLNLFDYQNTTIRQQNNLTTEYVENRVCVVSYIPLESAANTALRSDESFSKTTTARIGQNLIQSEPTSMAAYTQKTPLYVYNPVYSVTSGSKQYLPKGIYAEDDVVTNTRIVCSELKTNNEITDSWTKFKFANFLDVDTKYGEVTNLKAFGNRLYFWQDNAVGIASVNERSLITDNNMAELTLGTGGILTRFDYVATLNGSSIVNDKSITNSATTIYWYDFDKNEICAMTNGIVPLSKTKNVQSYINTLPRSAKTNAVSFYDKKYNEVWFRLYDKTLVYNEQLQSFTSFYTHNPNWFFPFSDKLVTIKDNNMYYLHNIYEVDDSDQPREERISKIEFVVNKDITNTKVFDNVVFSADLLDNDNTTPNIVKDVVFKTKTQETEAIDFNNIELREDNYRFPISREKITNKDFRQLASKSYLGRMRGKYLICDYTFDCNNNREFKLPYIKTTYRYSML